MLYASSLVIATIAFAVDIHSHAGGRAWYGPTLKSQIQIAQQLQMFSKCEAEFTADRLVENPSGVLALTKLLPVSNDSENEVGRIVVGYDPTDPLSCKLTVLNRRSVGSIERFKGH